MNKIDYFKAAIKANTYFEKEWVLSIFTRIVDGAPKSNNANLNLDSEGAALYPYRLYEVLDDPSHWYYYDPNAPSTLKKLEGASRIEPIYGSDERLDLSPGDLKCVDRPIKNTRYYTCILNCYVFEYPFQGKLKYSQKKFGGWIDNLVGKNAFLGEDPSKNTDNLITVPEIIKYHEAMTCLRGMTQIATTSVTQKSLIPNKNVRALRDKLLAENKDKLHDQTVVVGITQQLEALDRAELADDKSHSFYNVKNGAYSVKRMKVMNFYGTEFGFGDLDDVPKTFTVSLDEKLPLEDLPATIDTSRFGSYSRGLLTALGGAKVKYAARIFQNSRIVMDDCGVKSGSLWSVNDETKDILEHRYRINEKRMPELITSEFLSLNMGKRIEVRTPTLCMVESPSFCAKCLDKYLALRPNGLYLAPMDVSSAFMGASMGAMHGKVQATNDLDVEIAFGY